MSKIKIPSIINKIFSVIFFLVFAGLLYLIIYKGYENQSDRNLINCTFLQHINIILSFIVFTAVFIVIYLIYNRLRNRSRVVKIIRKRDYTPLIIIIVCAFMFIFQLISAYLLVCNPVTDLQILNGFSADFAYNGNFDLIHSGYMDHYMVKYQNNFAILFILSFLYRMSYLLTGSISVYLPVIINTLAINLSVILTVFLSRKLLGDRKAFFVLFLCVIFAPFYTYTVYYYTDSLSIPLVVGSIYLFVYAVGCDKRWRKYIMTALCGGMIFLGFEIKGSIFIILVAILIYTVLKLSLKRAAVLALTFLFGFFVFAGIYTTAFNQSKIVTKEMSEKYQYPYTHWIMMGLNGYGQYKSEDSRYTHSFSNKELKKEANIEKIKHRLEKFGVNGTIKHLAKKSVWTWQDGTYYISHHIEKPLHKNILHDFVLKNGPNHFIFYAYSCAFQLYLILMMIISSFKAIRNPKPDFMTLLRLIVFGAFLFFLIWETRSRYLYNFTPLFIILSVDGLSYICKGISKKISRSEIKI